MAAPLCHLSILKHCLHTWAAHVKIKDPWINFLRYFNYTTLYILYLSVVAICSGRKHRIWVIAKRSVLSPINFLLSLSRLMWTQHTINKLLFSMLLTSVSFVFVLFLLAFCVYVKTTSRRAKKAEKTHTCVAACSSSSR